MYRILIVSLLAMCTLVSCDKLGTEYPYDHVESEYSDAYDISIILEPTNVFHDVERSGIFANLQNGTTYTYDQSFGRGYDLHLAAYLDTPQLKLFSIHRISSYYSNSHLWNPNDPSTAKIQFQKMYISKDSNEYLYESFRNEQSLKYILSQHGLMDVNTSQDEYYIDPTDLPDSPQYVYFESLTTGTTSDSRDLKGILKVKNVTYSPNFLKIYLEGKVMYRY